MITYIHIVLYNKTSHQLTDAYLIIYKSDNQCDTSEYSLLKVQRISSLNQKHCKNVKILPWWAMPKQ